MITTQSLRPRRKRLPGPLVTPSTEWIGRILKDTYRVDKVIGEGGTGLVYAGFHLRLKVAVAVKVLKQNAGTLAFARFRKEAEITARLRHPHIVQILDYDVTPDGHAYIVTEWLDGETLSAFLKRRGAVSAQEAVAILEPVCDAVAAAHAAGVVHRDLKPANLLISKATGNTDQPLIKVLDFGIAKLTDVDPVRTEQGQTVGTPRYMSPEQIKVDAGEDVGPLSDEFALGSIAYELVAGRPAFPGSAHAAMLSVLEGKPTPLPGSVPRSYRRAVERALSVRADARFSSVSEFLAALREACEEPPPPPWQRNVMIGGAALSGLILAMILLLNLHPSGAGGPLRGQGAGGDPLRPQGPVITAPQRPPPPVATPLPVQPLPSPQPGPAPTATAPPRRPQKAEPAKIVVKARIAPAGSLLHVDGRPVHGGVLELPSGVAVRLRVDPPESKRLCCEPKELRYVAGEGRKPPVIELDCDRNCPIR